MKFKWKLFFLCIGIYIFTLAATSIAVTENNFAASLKKEVERGLKEEKNMHDSAELYLLANQERTEEKLDVKNWSSRLVEMFSSENVLLETYSLDKSPLASTRINNWSFDRDDLDKAVKGKCYVLRTQGGERYLFISDTLKIQDNKIIFSYIKNISELYKQKTEQYMTFLKIGALGLIFIGIIVTLATSYLIKPIDKLSQAAKDIASGNYDKSITVQGRDEIAVLGNQFNIMAYEIQSKINELSEEAERKQRFIDNLTHELRTPLTSVIGYSELLQKMNYEEAAFKKGLNYIHSEGDRMLKLISTLREMIILRKNNLLKEDTDCILLLSEALEVMKNKAEEKGIKFLVKGENLVIPLDKNMIKAVLVNLIDNAIKASDAESIIELGLELTEDKFSIYVRDFGKGMEAEELSRITEPFYRIDKARARKDGGLGLGLAICSEIINLLGGSLSFESKVGEGTKAVLIFKKESEGERESA